MPASEQNTARWFLSRCSQYHDHRDEQVAGQRPYNVVDDRDLPRKPVYPEEDGLIC